MEHIECKHEQEFATIRDEFKDLNLTSKNHVTWTMFWAVVVLLSGIFGSIMNQAYTKISSLEITTNEAKVTSTKIETQLSQIQKDILDIKIGLKEHSLEK